MTHPHKHSKRLRKAFGYAVRRGMFTGNEADELQRLLGYRNDIAHRLHLLSVDVGHSTWATDYLTFRPPLYRGDALDRLREYRRSLFERSRSLPMVYLSLDGCFFEHAETFYETELHRLDGRIRGAIEGERNRGYYLSGEQPVPKTVMLATEGYDKRQAA